VFHSGLLFCNPDDTLLVQEVLKFLVNSIKVLIDSEWSQLA